MFYIIAEFANLVITVTLLPEWLDSSIGSVGLSVATATMTLRMAEMMDGGREIGEAEAWGGREEPIGLGEEVRTNSILYYIDIISFCIVINAIIKQMQNQKCNEQVAGWEHYGEEGEAQAVMTLTLLWRN